ncbi:MAG: asparagine synthase (glutamine-hydrolyzing) [Gemmatimonadales bacterium]
MCGLVVILESGGASPCPERLARATASLRHRGPDDEGQYIHGSVGFGFQRLSIVDLSQHGHQPFVSPGGQLVMVYNGEIYNYVELRSELTALGYSFRSTSDTEVLLAAYDAWGEDCLPRFNGMFAFVIHDRRRGLLFGARDRFGVKPLFVHRDGQRTIFASEIKAIIATGYYTPRLAVTPAARFLCQGQGNISGTETLFEGVTAIEPGGCFTVAPGESLRSRRWWTLPDADRDPFPGDPVEEFATLFDDAVRIRLRSDVPVGIALSGGVDSTSIACAHARVRDPGAGPILAFTYNTPEYDESRYVADTVRRIGAIQVPLETSVPELFRSIPEVVRAHDEPLHSLAAIINYHLMRLARAHGVPVILNGGGSDEYLSGYVSYFRHHWHSVLRRHGAVAALREIRSYAEMHGGGTLGRFGALARQELGSRLRRRLGRSAPPLRIDDPWFRPLLRDVVYRTDTALEDDPLNSLLARSMTETPLPLYMREEDRNSMAHSIEARHPFLDYRLVSLAFRLPGSVKMSGPWNKHLLREAMRGRIPESVRTRSEKWGFAIPTREWVRGPLREPILDLLGSRTARERGLLDVDRIIADLRRPPNGRDFSTPLLRVVQFEVWCGLYGIG